MQVSGTKLERVTSRPGDITGDLDRVIGLKGVARNSGRGNVSTCILGGVTPGSSTLL